MPIYILIHLGELVPKCTLKLKLKSVQAEPCGANGAKLGQMGQSGTKQDQIGPNGAKWGQTRSNRAKQGKLGQIGQQGAK